MNYITTGLLIGLLFGSMGVIGLYQRMEQEYYETKFQEWRDELREFIEKHEMDYLESA